MTLQDSFEVAGQGLSAQAGRMRISAENIANMATPNYVRKIPVLTENNLMTFGDILSDMRKNGVLRAGIGNGPSGVAMVGTVEDTTLAPRVYNPKHPDADADGYITMSNSNLLADMSDAMTSSRMYEANLAILGIVRAMANKALDIGRGQ